MIEGCNSWHSPQIWVVSSWGVGCLGPAPRCRSCGLYSLIWPPRDPPPASPHRCAALPCSYSRRSCCRLAGGENFERASDWLPAGGGILFSPRNQTSSPEIHGGRLKHCANSNNSKFCHRISPYILTVLCFYILLQSTEGKRLRNATPASLV